MLGAPLVLPGWPPYITTRQLSTGETHAATLVVFGTEVVVPHCQGLEVMRRCAGCECVCMCFYYSCCIPEEEGASRGGLLQCCSLNSVVVDAVYS